MKKLIISLICLFVSAAICAQERPTPAEQQALDKITLAIKSVFDKLNNGDWMIRTDYYTNNMTLFWQQQGAPFGVNNNYARIYIIKPGSETYQKLIQPLEDKKNKFLQMQMVDSANKVDKLIFALSRFEVYANLNQARVSMAMPGKSSPYQALAAKGCAYSCQSGAYNPNGSGRTHYYVLVGNWDTAQCYATGHRVGFKFKHPENTPYIENVDFEFIGQCDFLSNFVKTTDWGVITAALTR